MPEIEAWSGLDPFVQSQTGDFFFCAAPCIAGVTWTETAGVGLALHNHLTVHNVSSLDDCRTACLQQQLFLCRSVDYDSGRELCMLSKYRLSDAPDYTLTIEGNVSHHDWVCNDGAFLTGTHQPHVDARVRACECVRACVRACVCVCVCDHACARVHVLYYMRRFQCSIIVT